MNAALYISISLRLCRQCAFFVARDPQHIKLEKETICHTKHCQFFRFLNHLISHEICRETEGLECSANQATSQGRKEGKVAETEKSYLEGKAGRNRVERQVRTELEEGISCHTKRCLPYHFLHFLIRSRLSRNLQKERLSVA